MRAFWSFASVHFSSVAFFLNQTHTHTHTHTHIFYEPVHFVCPCDSVFSFPIPLTSMAVAIHSFTSVFKTSWVCHDSGLKPPDHVKHLQAVVPTHHLLLWHRSHSYSDSNFLTLAIAIIALDTDQRHFFQILCTQFASLQTLFPPL